MASWTNDSDERRQVQHHIPQRATSAGRLSVWCAYRRRTRLRRPPAGSASGMTSGLAPGVHQWRFGHWSIRWASRAPGACPVGALGDGTGPSGGQLELSGPRALR